MACSKRDDCPLFPHLKLTLEFWRTLYCDSDTGYHNCARFKLVQTGADVPIDLMPDGKTIPRKAIQV